MEIRDQFSQWAHQMTKMPKATHWGLSISMGRASSSSSSGRTGTSDITVVRRLIWSRKLRDDRGIGDSCRSDQGIFRRPLKLIGTIDKMIRASQKRFRQKSWPLDKQVVTTRTKSQRESVGKQTAVHCMLLFYVLLSEPMKFVQILYPADWAIHFFLW